MDTTDRPLSISTERRGDAAIVRLSGSCSMNVSQRVGDCVKGLASEGFRVIAVDMSQVDFVESTTLGLLVAGYLRARKHNGDVRIVSPAPEIMRLFELTRLEQLFRIYPTVEAAIQ